jgi:hypothetical protein
MIELAGTANQVRKIEEKVTELDTFIPWWDGRDAWLMPFGVNEASRRYRMCYEVYLDKRCKDSLEFALENPVKTVFANFFYDTITGRGIIKMRQGDLDSLCEYIPGMRELTNGLKPYRSPGYAGFSKAVTDYGAEAAIAKRG